MKLSPIIPRKDAKKHIFIFVPFVSFCKNFYYENLRLEHTHGAAAAGDEEPANCPR
jgi:hypothetical protein